MDREALRERFDVLRATEFRRLDEGGHVYLDYTGSGLYAESQLRRQQQLLEKHVLGNPHSENPTSLAATRIIEAARRDILDFFGADPSEYVVSFTANASAALKLVGEAYPFEEGSKYVLLEDNHNSVNGIREFARARGAQVIYLPLDDDLRLRDDTLIPPAGEEPGLFAFPAQSNFSGVQHSLALIDVARARGYDVLLDAAAYAPTNVLDLTRWRPDFVCVSFYKMFGFPTGVGALIARRAALARLRRPWFAGGTVEYVSVQNRIHRLQVGAEGFEDGTPNFLGIAAVPVGLAFLRDVGVDAIHRWVGAHTTTLLALLQGLRHGNGRPLVDLYGPVTTEGRGGTVAFNLRDPEGRLIPYYVVEHEASRRGISLRGGCFCNPGAAEAAFHLPAGKALSCFQSFEPGAFDLKELSDCFDEDIPVGALRASLGVATNEADLRRLESFLEEFRDRASVGGELAAADEATA